MWPVALLALSIISVTLWYKFKSAGKYRLDVLALISSGAATMFLVDSLYSYFEKGEFIELSPDAALLSAVLVLFTIALWAIIALRRAAS